jgi:hypothetical protein
VVLLVVVRHASFSDGGDDVFMREGREISFKIVDGIIVCTEISTSAMTDG